MLPVSIVRVTPFVAAGLALAGCRSAATVPGFSVVVPYHSLSPVQRVDTVASRTASYFFSPQRQPKENMQLRITAGLGGKPRRKKKQVSRAIRSFTTAASSDTASCSTKPPVLRATSQSRAFKLWNAQTLVHYSLHSLFPAVLALVFFPAMWQFAYLVMLATMLMDLDHLLAKPIFDPLRCSVGYHPLHSFYAVPVYMLLLLFPATQIVAVGLLFHLVTDTVDCLWNFRHCHECYLNSRIYALRKWVRKLLRRQETE